MTNLSSCIVAINHVNGAMTYFCIMIYIAHYPIKLVLSYLLQKENLLYESTEYCTFELILRRYIYK